MAKVKVRLFCCCFYKAIYSNRRTELAWKKLKNLKMMSFFNTQYYVAIKSAGKESFCIELINIYKCPITYCFSVTLFNTS